MSKDTAGAGGASTVGSGEIERFVRDKLPELIRAVLDEEVTEVLGPGKSERRNGVDPAQGYRNGYGKPRRLATSIGTVVGDSRGST